MAVFNIGYDFHLGNGDNGNVYGITNYRDTSRTQTFTYDTLNRLASARNAGSDCTKTTVNVDLLPIFQPVDKFQS